MITNKEILCHINVDIREGFFPKKIQLEEILFFDIETTGLSPENSQVFLIGAIVKSQKEASLTLVQYLAENCSKKEETMLLQAFSDLAFGKKYLVHYNGSSFDIPFLIHRCRFLGIDSPFRDLPQIDLYRELMRLPGFFRQMPDHKQKTFENLMNYPRKDLLSGKEMIKFYQIYEKSRENKILELLLLHNQDDLKGMLSLLPLGKLKDFLAGSFSVYKTEEILEASLEGDQKRELLFSLKLPFFIPVRLTAVTDLCRISLENTSGKIKLPLYEGTLKYFYPDYQNYYYLPYEDEAIHKSIAVYTDLSRRRKAKASECYKKYTGTFVSAPGSPSLPLLRETYKSSAAYTLWPFSDMSPASLHNYLQEILKWSRSI